MRDRPEAFGWVRNAQYRETRPASMVGRVTGLIQGASEVVIASTFLLADDRVERSLSSTWGQKRCYVMLAAETRLGQDIGGEFDRTAHDRHIRTLKGIAGNALVRSADDFHAKIVLADPVSDAPRGLLLTANLATEGLERNQELFVELEPDEVREAESVLRWAFWERSAHELAHDKLRDCRPLGEIKPVKTGRILQTEPHRSIRRRIMEILDCGPKWIVAASFGWDEGHPVVERLCSLSRQGTSVTVLTRAKRKSTQAALVRMKKAGIRILGFSWFHAKAVISDTHALVMSANIEERGMERGFELGLSLDGKRAEDVRRAVSGWMANYQYEFEAGGAAPRASEAPAAASGGRDAQPEPPGSSHSPGGGRRRGRGAANPEPPAASAARPADEPDARPAEPGPGDNLQIGRAGNRRDLLYRYDRYGKEPDMSSMRLEMVLTGEDRIGEGVDDVDEHKIAVARGRIVVADTAGRQLKTFDGDGTFTGVIPCRKSERGEPISPGMVALGSQNRTIVADDETVHVLDPAGISIAEYDAEGTIESVQTTGQGNVVVEVEDECRILDPACKLLDKITGSEFFYGKNHVLAKVYSDGYSDYVYEVYGLTARSADGKMPKTNLTKQINKIDDSLDKIALDDRGNVYAAAGESIHVFAPSRGRIKKIPLEHGCYGMVALDLNRIAVSGHSNLWMFDGKTWHSFEDNKLLSISNDGAVILDEHDSVYRLTPPDTVRKLLYNPGKIRIAVDSADRMIVADHGCVKILNRDGSIAEAIINADGQGGRFGEIKAIAVDRQDRIVLLDGDHTRVFDPDGGFAQSFTKREYSAKVDANLAKLLDSYPLLAYDRYGRIIMGDGDYIKITDGDTTIKSIDVGSVSALTVDRWDRIIVAHDSGVTIYDRNGSRVGSATGRYIKADGVAADAAGRIIVSGRDSSGNGMIQVFCAAPQDAGRRRAASHPEGKVCRGRDHKRRVPSK